MIYTVTFNPSLDYIVSVENFTLGKTNRTHREQILPGGKGINVSIVLGNMGIENRALGFLAGFTGREIEKRAAEFGVQSEFIYLKEGNSRINLKLKDIEGTEINGMGPVISGDKLQELIEKADRLQPGDGLVLAGSIPVSIPTSVYSELMARLAGKGDLRKVGSGNIGATNVLRTGSKSLALLTILLDASKAGIAAYAAFLLVPEKPFIFCGFMTTTNTMASLIAGTMGIIGHNFPVWLKFKGGKGVASTFGFILATNPLLALLALLTWLIMAFATHYSSLSAIVAAILVPVYAFFITDPVYSIFYGAIAVLVLVRHHANIGRLLKGTESKINLKKKQK